MSDLEFALLCEAEAKVEQEKDEYHAKWLEPTQTGDDYMQQSTAEDLIETLKLIAIEITAQDLRKLILGEELDDATIDGLSPRAQEAYSFYVVTVDLYT